MIIFIIYLIGYILGYLLVKLDYKYEFKKWTIGDRAFALTISLFSWIIVLISIIKYFTRDNDKPAKW